LCTQNNYQARALYSNPHNHFSKPHGKKWEKKKEKKRKKTKERKKKGKE